MWKSEELVLVLNGEQNLVFFPFACQEAHSKFALQLPPVTRALSYLSVRTGRSCLF